MNSCLWKLGKQLKSNWFYSKTLYLCNDSNVYIVRTYDLHCSLIRSVLGKVALFDDNRYWISGAFTLKVKQMIKRWLWLHSEKTVAFLWKGQCLVSICNSHMSAFFQNTSYRAVKCPLVEMEPLATYKSWHKSYVVIN